MLESLTAIANRHATDKGTIGPSRSWGAHNYTDVYEGYLQSLRNAEINILEIGLGVTGEGWNARIVHGRNSGGASLKMWHDYFAKARIFGIDVNSCSHLENERISTYVADQGCLRDLAEFDRVTAGVEFHVIVDDGSHRPDHQQVSLGHFFKRLVSGGLYFIEDLLPNGYGDHAFGRSSSKAAVNTRAILKHLESSGEFLEPNTLVNGGDLLEMIDTVRFHTPAVRASFGNFLFPNRAPHFKPNTEKLCVLKKL